MAEKTAREWIDRLLEEVPDTHLAKDEFSDDISNGDLFGEIVEQSPLVTPSLTVNYVTDRRDDDLYFIVYNFKDNRTKEEVLIKFSGWYSSWNDTDWSFSPRIVTPVPRTVIDYV